MKCKDYIRLPREPRKTAKSGLIAASILFSAVLAEPAMAALRCGTHLVVAGEAKSYEVMKKCGQPDERFGDTWIYEKSGFTHELRFDNDGRLIDINRQ